MGGVLGSEWYRGNKLQLVVALVFPPYHLRNGGEYETDTFSGTTSYDCQPCISSKRLDISVLCRVGPYC
jgi:hypothetical protein